MDVARVFPISNRTTRRFIYQRRKDGGKVDAVLGDDCPVGLDPHVHLELTICAMSMTHPCQLGRFGLPKGGVFSTIFTPPGKSL